MFPKDLPAENHMPKGSAVFKGHENIFARKYRAAQNKSQNKPKAVHLLSTKHKPVMKNTSRRDHEGNVIQKPEAIIYYNHNMGGVDKIDQQLHCISVARKTFKCITKCSSNCSLWQCLAVIKFTIKMEEEMIFYSLCMK